MDKEQMKGHTKEFAKRVIFLCRQLPNNRDGRLIGDQLFRSGTSVAANYRAVCRARSRADFISKLGVVLEEADETHLWLEIIRETKVLPSDAVVPLLKDANELIAIFVASLNTAKGNQRSPAAPKSAI